MKPAVSTEITRTNTELEIIKTRWEDQLGSEAVKYYLLLNCNDYDGGFGEFPGDSASRQPDIWP